MRKQGGTDPIPKANIKTITPGPKGNNQTVLAQLAARVVLLAIVTMIGLAGLPAFAQECDTTGHGDPRLANIAATSSTIVVSFLLLCATPPQSVEMRQNGTSERNFQDGRLLGSVRLGSLQNVAAVTASNLTPDTTFQNLRLCATYLDSPPWCSGTFGARTASASSGVPAPPKNFAAKPTSYVTIHLSWQNSPGADHLSLTRQPGDNNQPTSTINISGPNTFFNATNLHPATTYSFKLCEVNVHGQSCAQASARTPAPPPAPAPLPPEGLLDFHVTALSTPRNVHITWIPPFFDPATSATLDLERRILVMKNDVLTPGEFQLVASGLSPTAVSADDDFPIQGLIFEYRVCFNLNHPRRVRECSKLSNRVVGHGAQ